MEHVRNTMISHMLILCVICLFKLKIKLFYIII